MMKLYSSVTSPFGRKIKIAAAMLGLSDKFEMVPTNTMDDNDPIKTKNPLAKIPALELEDGLVLFDSMVILEYFDHLAGGNAIIPADPARRFKALSQSALANGLIDAAILQVYEVRMRAEGHQDEGWVARQKGKVSRALAALEAKQPDGPRTVADITVACALGYLDFRFPGTWRDGHPKLVAWLDAFAAEFPIFEATRAKA